MPSPELPEAWKSKRQIIVETYLETGSIPDTAQKLYGKRDVSYVRTIVTQWTHFLHKKNFV